MPAIISLGLGGALPGEPSKQEILDHLAAFADYDFMYNFHEVVEGELYRIARRDGETQIILLDPTKPLPGWSPYEWNGEGTYAQWYAAMMETWNSHPGGDLTYDEWSKMGSQSILVPYYDGKTEWVRVPPFEDKLGVCAVEAAISIGFELDLPKHYFHTLDRANEFAFLARISG